MWSECKTHNEGEGRGSRVVWRLGDGHSHREVCVDLPESNAVPQTPEEVNVQKRWTSNRTCKKIAY